MNSGEFPESLSIEHVLAQLDKLATQVDLGFERIEQSLARIETLLGRIDSRLEGVENLTVMVRADFDDFIRRLKEYIPELGGNDLPF
jgi:hypothetical protein